MSRETSQSCALVVDDEAVVRRGLARILEDMGVHVELAADGKQALKMLAEVKFDIVLLDVKLGDSDGMEILRHVRAVHPESAVVMVTGYPCIQNAVESIRLGAFDYLTKPFGAEAVESVVRKAQDLARLGTSWPGDREEKDGRDRIDEMLGESAAMRRVLRQIERVARTDSTVLLTGASGTGKELAARAVHRRSKRADGPFVAADCGALSEALLERELFGHVKGSFTGAHESRHGILGAASGGSCFLDEVANFSLNMQAKLLRVIQEREFAMVGDPRPIRLDVRFIAASNRDLAEAVQNGTFREDLYYRLSVISISMPPLRERGEDIRLLARHFVDRYSKLFNVPNREISEQVLEVLDAYSWPGNVRQLQHAIERIMVLESSDVIELGHLPAYVCEGAVDCETFSGGRFSLKDVEKRYIQFVLRRTKGKRQEAARILQVDRKTLARKMERLGL